MKRSILSTLAAAGIGAVAALGLIVGIDHDPDLDPTPKASHSVTEPAEVIAEDDPRWNCLTMGNRTCGPDYIPVTAADAAALASDGDGPADKWRECLISVGDTTYVVCPDGTVVTS